MSGNDGYEIHSILEFGDTPTPGLWWVLSPNGKSPTIRFRDFYCQKYELIEESPFKMLFS